MFGSGAKARRIWGCTTQMPWKLNEAASPPGSISLGLSQASAMRCMVAPVYMQSFWIGDVRALTCRNPANLQSPAMALGRVLLSSLLVLGFYNAEAASLDLDGLKDQALIQITGSKLMSIVRTPLAMPAWKSHESFFVTSDPTYVCDVQKFGAVNAALSLLGTWVMQLLS